MDISTLASRRGVTVGAALAAFGICYAEVGATLVREWSINNLYSYGFAVPFIAAYIYWVRAQQAPPFEVSPDYRLGVPAAVAGMAMLIIGRFGAILALEQASLVVTLTALVLLLAGRQAFRVHWFAVAYLLLMIPVWNELLARLQDPSRLISAKLALSFLHLVGMPALRQGTILVVPSHQISVLRECSGVNQLVALTAMVLPAAYLWLDTNARRFVVIAFAVLVSYVSNGIRVAMVSWLAGRGYGDGLLTGSSHLLQGLGVSALGYVAIGVMFSILARSTRAPRDESEAARAKGPAEPGVFAARRPWVDFAVLCVMLAVGASSLSARQLDVNLPQGLGALDSRIGEWSVAFGAHADAVPFPGIDDALVDVGGYPTPTGERRFEAVDEELIRPYRDPAGNRVDLYIGYYERQDQGKELTGEASSALDAAASTLTFSSGSETITVKEIARTDGARRRGVIFWYDVNGRIVTDIYRAKGYSIWDALTRRRTNGAVVMLAWQAPSGVDGTAARDRAMAFARELMPVLRHRLPS